METKTLNFYKNLPKKVCMECGNKMEEWADCYVNVCPDCQYTHDKWLKA